LHILNSAVADEAENVIVIYIRSVQKQVIRQFLGFRSSPFVCMKRNKIGIQLTYLFLEKLCINKSYFFIKGSCR
jgi:hypothetical protein